MTLADLRFSDLFLPELVAHAWYKISPSSLDRVTVDPALHPELKRLWGELQARAPGELHDFRIDYSGMRLRVERMEISDASTVFVMRRYGVPPSSLAGLGFPKLVASQLLSMKDGLILFVGQTGSGKSTTAMAVVVEWLSQHGGVCWTVENPVEIDITGDHGKGVCYQTEVSRDADFGLSIIRMLRASPNLIMVGEIRDDLAAREAIHAATSGHLVVSTFHGNDIVSGLARFAGKAGVDSHGFADALRAILHLRLKIDESAPQERILIVEPLMIVGNAADGIRSTIRAGDFHLLKSEIERQRRLFMSGGLP